MNPIAQLQFLKPTTLEDLITVLTVTRDNVLTMDEAIRREHAVPDHLRPCVQMNLELFDQVIGELEAAAKARVQTTAHLEGCQRVIRRQQRLLGWNVITIAALSTAHIAVAVGLLLWN